MLSNRDMNKFYKKHQAKSEQLRRKTFRKVDMNMIPEPSWAYPLDEPQIGASFLGESDFGEEMRGSGTMTGSRVMEMRRKLSQDRMERNMKEQNSSSSMMSSSESLRQGDGGPSDLSFSMSHEPISSSSSQLNFTSPAPSVPSPPTA